MFNDLQILPNLITQEEIDVFMDNMFLVSEAKKVYFSKPELYDMVRKSQKGDGVLYLTPMYTIMEKLGLEHTKKIIKMVSLLHYPTGAFQNLHADNCSIHPKTGAVQRIKAWTHSLVIYLNDDFEGGEIVYPSKNITYKPIKGSAVIHPAGASHIHKVNPVTKGDRYCVVVRLVLPEENIVVNNAT